MKKVKVTYTETWEHKFEMLAPDDATDEDLTRIWTQRCDNNDFVFLDGVLTDGEASFATEYRIDDDAFYVPPYGVVGVYWIYYNPDSIDGGQYVSCFLSLADIAKAKRANLSTEETFGYLEDVTSHYIYDVGTDGYNSEEERFLRAQYRGRTEETLQSLFKLAEEYGDVNPARDAKIAKAEQCLIDNGIDKDEAQTVLQALGYILLDEELYPE